MTEAFTWLTYPGKAVKAALFEVLGPDGAGEMLVAVEARWDDKTNTTRVGFSYAQQSDFDRRQAEFDVQVAAARRGASYIKDLQ